MATPRSKAQKQFQIIEGYKFNLAKALDRLDHTENVIEPGLKRIAELEAKGKVLDFRLDMKPMEIEG